MSSKQIEIEFSANQKRMTSITKRLGFMMFRKRLLGLLVSQALLGVLIYLCFFAGLEIGALGRILPFYGYERQIVQGEGSEVFYRLSQDDEILAKPEISSALKSIRSFLVILTVLRVVFLLPAISSDRSKIREVLTPLNEIALQADRLSKMSFTEDKYQLIEEAITRIQPQDAQTLSLEDEDLSGIEAAMNNLLKRVRDSYRQQARFVNDASHELRTPIAVIKGYAGMLSRWGREDEKILDEAIEAIVHETGHMEMLVEQLLFLARGDSGKTTLSLTTFSLNELMQEIYEESFMIDESHRYRLTDDGSGEISLTADRGLIKQAVRILIDNANKFTPEGEDIALSYGRRDGSLFISVQDNGIGMEEKDIAHIFERFYRSDEVRGYDGTGLGLSIAKWIVDKHRGHFEITSRQSLGTRIVIVLPA